MPDCPRLFSSAISRVLYLFSSSICILVIAGCVSGEKKYSHFVGVDNISKDAVYDMSYSYGLLQKKEIFTAKKSLAPRFGDTPSYGAIMPVPDRATVCWTYENERYNISVPVKKYVETPERLSDVSFLIQESGLYVCVDDEEVNCFCMIDHPRSCGKIIGPFPAQKGACPLPY